MLCERGNVMLFTSDIMIDDPIYAFIDCQYLKTNHRMTTLRTFPIITEEGRTRILHCKASAYNHSGTMSYNKMKVVSSMILYRRTEYDRFLKMDIGQRGSHGYEVLATSFS